MVLRVFFKTLFTHCGDQNSKLGGHKSEARLSVQREKGEATLSLVLVLLIGGILFTGLLWLNRHFEMKTKEHLRDFQKDWKTLAKKYKA